MAPAAAFAAVQGLAAVAPLAVATNKVCNFINAMEF